MQQRHYYGDSQIVDPCGKVVACLGAGEGIVTHRVDLRVAVLQSRTEAFFGLSLLQDRRPERYAALLDQSHRFPGGALHPAPPDAVQAWQSLLFHRDPISSIVTR